MHICGESEYTYYYGAILPMTILTTEFKLVQIFYLMHRHHVSVMHIRCQHLYLQRKSDPIYGIIYKEYELNVHIQKICINKVALLNYKIKISRLRIVDIL